MPWVPRLPPKSRPIVGSDEQETRARIVFYLIDKGHVPDSAIEKARKIYAFIKEG